jgi:hypothetical protein
MTIYRKHGENANDNLRSGGYSHFGSGGNDERTCYHCGLLGFFTVDSIRFTHYKHTKEQRNNVNKATATASLSTAEIATRSD